MKNNMIQSIVGKELLRRLNQQTVLLDHSSPGKEAEYLPQPNDANEAELNAYLDQLFGEDATSGEKEPLQYEQSTPDEENRKTLQRLRESGGLLDLWMAEGKEELLYAASLLVPEPKDSFLPMKYDDSNNGGTAFLFYCGDPSCNAMVATKEDDTFSQPERCLNDSWEDELFSNRSVFPKIIFFPTDKLPPDRSILLCRIQTDITDADMKDKYKKQLDDFRSYSDYLKGRQVLFASPETTELYSLRENAWWKQFSDTGRFHIVMCNLRNISVGEDDVSSPVQGALRNIEEHKMLFYPNAWRHVIL